MSGAESVQLKNKESRATDGILPLLCGSASYASSPSQWGSHELAGLLPDMPCHVTARGCPRRVVLVAMQSRASLPCSTDAMSRLCAECPQA